MKRSAIVLYGALTVGAAFADTVKFDQDESGKAPRGWMAGVTGDGEPKWSVRIDATEASRPRVLMQTGEGRFPWCVKRDVSITDGFVVVKFKPISGSEDQAGGVVWRWKDGDNYYVARANAVEENVALYYVANGTRHMLKSVYAPVSSKRWHTLRAEYTGDTIKVMLDGDTFIELQDKHLTQPGAVGVWTKADSVTAFVDFSYGSNAN